MGFKAKHMDGTTYWHALTPREGVDATCGGTGYLSCHCGGDQCICGNFGEVPCDGCEDCERERDDDYPEDDPGLRPDDDYGDAPPLSMGQRNVLPSMRDWAKRNGLG